MIDLLRNNMDRWDSYIVIVFVEILNVMLTALDYKMDTSIGNISEDRPLYKF